MVEHNRFYIIRFYPYTIHKLRREIGFGVLNVSLKQACRCATQWRSVYHVSNGVSCIQRCFLYPTVFLFESSYKLLSERANSILVNSSLYIHFFS